MYKRIAILMLCLLINPAFAAAGDDNVLLRMFSWWNNAMATPDGFTEAGFRRYYTEDASIMINGKLRVRGIGNMVEHFRGIQQRTDFVEISLPFEEGFESGDRIFTYHLVRASENGTERTAQVMGYAIIDSGKISYIHFLSLPAPDANGSRD